MRFVQGHKAVTPVRLKPADPLSGVKHSITEPQHDYFQKKENVLIFKPLQGSRGCVKGQNICLIIVCFIPFNLKCNMATFKKLFQTFEPHPHGSKCIGKIIACTLVYVLICNVTILE